MNEQNYTNDHTQPREETYQTGPTQPPKSRRGLIAVLLIAVILLGGVVSILGVANIRLLGRLESNAKAEDAALSFSAQNYEALADAVTLPETTEALVLESQVSPTAAANIPQSGGLSLQEIYASAILSVASISCSLPEGNTTGTGVILSEDGYIVTNSHVVEDAQSITVRLHDERVLTAVPVGADPVTDLAVIRVDAQDLTPAVFGDSSALQVGDAVAAIGDPLGAELRGTMTDGIVSAINRDLFTGGRNMTLIQTNAALNSGNSGGPLLNCYGQVIGINTMKISDYVDMAGVEGLGFAIPSSTVAEIVEQLVAQGYVSGRPWLGISGQEVHFFYQIYKHYPQGLYITEVDPASDAAAKGISPGDILLSIDDQRITDAETLEEAMYAYNAGDQVTVVVYRSGLQYELPLLVGEVR